MRNKRIVAAVWLIGLLVSAAAAAAPVTDPVLGRFLELKRAHPRAGGPPACSRGMVASAEPLATLAGLAALKAGGNAMDSAVATAFTLAVSYPTAGNLGGGGFLIYLPQPPEKPVAFDFRECAPLSARPDMYLDERGAYLPDSSIRGFPAAGVPGTVRGLFMAWKNHGSLPWASLLLPAIHLAEDGFPVSKSLAASLAANRDLLGAFVSTRKIFFAGEKTVAAGALLKQPDLAATLRRIAAGGDREFYEGQTASVMAAEMARRGGWITAEDLRQYRVAEREPVRFDYRGVEIVSMPPPSSGGVVLAQILHILEPFPLNRLPRPAYLNLLAEAMRLAFVDRSRLMGDPDFVQMPLERMLSRAYADNRRTLIKPGLALDSDYFKDLTAPAEEKIETTHFCTADGAGRIATLTYTLNGSYGCGEVVEGLGFLMNNEMDDFAVKPGVPNMYGLIQGPANAIAPRKRPLSSMSPTIVFRHGQPILALGSPGGPTIITAVGQVMLNHLDLGMDLATAIASPRIHHQWLPDRIDYEAAGFSAATIQALRNMGYVTQSTDRIGLVEAIAIAWKTDGTVIFTGVSDPRGSGLAMGF